MSRWGFSDALAFAVAMTMRDMSAEKQKRLIKTQKFYQDCYERIADDSKQAYEIVKNVVTKASRRYIPVEIERGWSYLSLYAFSLVIEKQGKVTREQNKIIKIFFDNFDIPFSQNSYLNVSKTGEEIGDFREIITIKRNYIGGFWINFFRALYKSGTQKDLQEMVDCVTSIIMRFSILGNPNSNLSEEICQSFIDSVNYQINQVCEIPIDDIDWFGIVPIEERVEEVRVFFETLIDNSDITETVSREELYFFLELLLLNCICDVVMLTKKPKSIKLKMIEDAVNFSGIHPDVSPQEYISEIANNTENGQIYQSLFSAGPPLGSFWFVFFQMGSQLGGTYEPIGIVKNIYIILLQIENYLDEKYRFLGKDAIVKDYMHHIFQGISEKCNEEE